MIHTFSYYFLDFSCCSLCPLPFSLSVCVWLTNLWVHLLYYSTRPFEISNHCQPSLPFPSLNKPSLSLYVLCPNHHGHPPSDVLQLALFRGAEDTPCAGSPLLKREVHPWPHWLCPCSCSSVCGSLTQICASLAWDMWRFPSSSAGQAMFGAGWHCYCDTTGPEELWQLMVPEDLALRLSPLTHDSLVLTSGFLHSATILELFSLSAHSHQAHAFHSLLWCSWQSDGAVLWECSLLYGSHTHDEKESSGTRQGFVFKC